MKLLQEKNKLDKPFTILLKKCKILDVQRMWNCHVVSEQGMISEILKASIFLVVVAERPLNPSSFIIHAVSNIICSIVFGDRFDYQDKKFLDIIDWIEENNQLQASIQTQVCVVSFNTFVCYYNVLLRSIYSCY